MSGGDARKQYILETTGTGVAIFDYDNDDLPDMFIANGTTLDGDGDGGTVERSPLSKSRATPLRRRHRARRLARVGWGQGVCAADYDSDGHRDLFVTYYGQTRSIATKGTARSGTLPRRLACKERPRWDTGCSFFDYDLDGRLDLSSPAILKFDRARVPAPAPADTASGRACR